MTENAELKHLSEIRSTIANRQQKQASDPGLSVWVEASAGTGKTKVLSDRVFRLFLDGVHPSQILCLTYTKAAAVEMNERISSKLAQWAVMEDDKLRNELAQLTGSACRQDIINRARTLFALTLDVPGGLKIQTIHSFCQEILKRFPLEAGVPPYFSIMDDRTAREILSDVSRELVLSLEQEEKTPAVEAIAYLTGHIREFKFSKLMSTLAANHAKILNVLKSYPTFDLFLQALQNKLKLPEIISCEEAFRNFINQIDWQQIQTISKVLQNGSKKDKTKGEILAAIAKQSAENFDYDAYKNVFLTGGKIRAELAYKAALEQMPEIADIMYALAEDILKFEDLRQRLQLFEATRAIMAVASDLAKRYQAYKQKNARLDYEDLIMITKRLLENRAVADWILYKLDASLNHILIDEAQDTSPHQWAIIRALSDDFFAGEGTHQQTRTIFAVGDRKQSIYSFQGANPEEFDNMRVYFSQKAANFATVKLDVSFRSTQAVLETVNNLFAEPEAQSGVVIDGEKVNHLPFRVGQAGLVEIWPLIEQAPDEKDDVWYPPIEYSKKQTASARLAQRIAQKIRETVVEKKILPSQNRPIRYGDFMVLVQRRNAFAQDFVRECKAIGVEIAGVDKLKLLEEIAVADLLSLGRFLLLPTDDLSLAEVLKSPLFGLDDDDLFKLCYNRPASLWQNLYQSSNYAEIKQSLLTLLDKVDYIRPYELFNYVLSTMKGRRKFAERLGMEAEDALDEFMNLTLAYEQEHIPDLQSFMQWIGADNIEIKRELEQSDVDAVRLMTVHGSKGLQAPIVILPDTTRIVYAKREAKLLSDNEDMIYYPLSADFYEEQCNNIYEKQKEKAFEEYRRLLYVALTRAEDNLYICGIKPKNGEDNRSWYHLCENTLNSCGYTQEDGSIVYQTPQLVAPKESKHKSTSVSEIALPDWLNQTAMPETPLSKPFMPSHAEDEDDSPADSPLCESGHYFRRGLIMHRLLQLLKTGKDKEKLKDFIRAYLLANAPELTDFGRQQIEKEIMNLYQNPAFEFIFSNDSAAEVPIAGIIDNRVVSAQIDRLYIGADKILIVDFKTNRPAAADAAEVSTLYRRQLQIYKQLVTQIYPQKQVETYILWTNTAKLMKID